MFPVTSRYHGIDTATFTDADGKKHPYLRRRFLPDAVGTVLAEHAVTQGERLDNITARYLGDPEQFWRLCDANDAMDPAELTAEIGRRLRVPMPGVDAL
jgi:hypothetical protein